MKKWLLLTVSLVVVAFLFSCNKQKPQTLDYTKKMEEGVYTPQGLPGEGHVGSPPGERRYSGHATGFPEDDTKTEKKDPEKKPEETDKKDQPPGEGAGD